MRRLDSNEVPRAAGRRGRAVLTAAALLVGGAGCALLRGPEEEGPSHGGLPQDVRAAPASTSLGPVTAPTPVQPDITPPPPGSPPLGTVEVDRPGTRVYEDTATRNLRVRLDSILTITSGELTGVPIPVARATIDGMRRFLAGQRDGRLVAVREELAALHEALGRSPIDARATGHILERLGMRTTAAASAAGVLAGRVALIGDRLQDAGKRMAADAR